MRDLYEILGVERDVDARQIKQAYRELTRRFHPDVNPGRAWAEELYREVIEAHEILGDSRKRSLYDEFGELSFTRGFDPGLARARGRGQRGTSETKTRAAPPPGPWGPPRSPAGGTPEAAAGSDPESRETDLPTPEFEDLEHARSSPFENFFSKFWRGRTVTLDDIDDIDELADEGRDARAEVRLTLARAVAGCPVRVRVKPNDASEARIVEVEIPAGTEDGATLRLSGFGEPGTPPGDLLLTVRVDADEALQRDGLHLRLTVPVTLLEVYTGGPIDVETPHGIVSVRLSPGASIERPMRLRGQGVRLPDGRSGDLTLHLRLRLPEPGDATLTQVLRRLQGNLRVRDH